MSTNLVIESRADWRWWVTPRYLRDKPVHRWCVFPHSFTSELVHGLIDEWALTSADMILDPFCGAGTTLLAAKEKGISATGYDLSPFAVFATRVKLGHYSPDELADNWKELRNSIDPSKWNGASREYPELIRKALPGHLLGAFDSVNNRINKMDFSRSNRYFFKMALLSTMPKFSRAVATGGWLKWIDRRLTVKSLPDEYEKQVQSMIKDLLSSGNGKSNATWKVGISDARSLPDAQNTFSAIITSPPYPNRHDYTRVFGVELMFGFLDWEQTRNLRYQSFESHPESHPKRPDYSDYSEPKQLAQTLKRLEKSNVDERMPGMIKGYFIDIHLSLREVKRVCRSGARIAYVVGNAQYGGIPVVVDELIAEIGSKLGLKCEKILAVRYRGNSAQQMSEYGRKPSRESIVILKKR
ncbi:MAG TPA: DNA methyltransferase [Candidatus Omnitrophota bacterium]|nr:DNA methyltransferase [Candidatus Omnitrophota bacterium]